ncbi:insulin gene enhancer protein ISL-1-like isoform X2 [Corticium candelabrum]|nr:insulin gene enhancer protein ISL-1-like isoform X2 [Corticium candelabrum]
MKKPPPTCTGCGQPIEDRYILRVAPDLEWHAGCLRCSECHARLDETSHCYVKQERIYCRRDYQRLFGTKCPKCQLTIGEQDYVMRAGQQAYHTDCFSCSVCNRRLTKGDMYYLTNSGSILCKADRDAGRQLTLQHQQKPMPAGSSSRKQTAGGTLISTQDSMTLKGGSASGSGSSTSSTPDSTIPPVSTEPTSKTGSLGEPAGSTDKSHTKTKKKKTSDKPARVRTVLTEKQLHTLRTCYAANPRPDALMKEQLCELTGLTPRVIRVWFQNKRCKDKKKAMMTQRPEEGRQGPIIIPLGMDQHGLMRLPGTEGSLLPPLPSIPTIPGPGTPATPLTPGPINVLPVLSSCSSQPGLQGMPQHHFGEPHTPTTPVTGQMFSHLGSPPPPPPLSQHFSPTQMPPMYHQLQTIPTAPHQQPLGYPMPLWQHQVSYPHMDEPPPLYPPHSSLL